MNSENNFDSLKTPRKGDKLYIPGSYHISRGSDDVAGGLATIDHVAQDEDLPQDHINRIFVSFTEVPGVGYNYRSLLKQQDELAIRYAGKVAHPDPDVDTPWIQEGDSVNGSIYTGNPIW